MKELPILFNTDMVRALLEGRKTQTRRVMKVQPDETGVYEPAMAPKAGALFGKWAIKQDGKMKPIRCPYGKVGDVLWVRETFAYVGKGLDPGYLTFKATYPDDLPPSLENVPYDFKDSGERWKPSIFMPKKISRIKLEIADVRVERLQDISEEDAKAEGIEHLFNEKAIKERPELALDNDGYMNYLWHGHYGSYGQGNKQSDEWEHQYSSYKTAKGSFSSLWHSINSKRGYGWDTNPWVWVYTFKRIS